MNIDQHDFLFFNRHTFLLYCQTLIDIFLMCDLHHLKGKLESLNYGTPEERLLYVAFKQTDVDLR